MEGIIGLAVVWFVISLFSKAVKRAGKGAERPQDDDAEVEVERKPKPVPAPKASVWTQITQMMEEGADGEGESGEGQSRGDAACVGGSMAHTRHEGATLQGVDREMPSQRYQAASLQAGKRRGMQRTERENSPVPQDTVLASQSVSPFGLSREDMRRAVVMSEVLGKPVSMRGRAR